MRHAHAVFAAAVSIAAALALAAAAESEVQPAGPLAGLPSPPGDHLEKIAELPDNAWLALGAPTADPDHGSARGRAWSSKMPAAPELGGAFLTGEGVHGWHDPDTGRYMDDLWFYNLRAHRWVCVHPGTPVANGGADIARNADGFELGPAGHPTPIAWQAHAYGMNAWDPDRGLFLSMPCDGGYWKQALPERAKAFERERPHESHAGPWIYDVAAGHWTRHRTQAQRPRSSFGDTLVYLPTLNRVWFRHNARNSSHVALYDPATHTWESIEERGPLPPFGIDANDCYDPHRNRIYLAGGKYPVPEGNGLWIYDVATHTWIDPKPQNVPAVDSQSYGPNEALLHYDTAARRVVLIRHRGPAELRGVHVYDPDANRWSTEPTELPDFGGRNTVSGFYDPALNAHVLFAAGDSRDDGLVWVYRYRVAD